MGDCLMGEGCALGDEASVRKGATVTQGWEVQMPWAVQLKVCLLPVNFTSLNTEHKTVNQSQSGGPLWQRIWGTNAGLALFHLPTGPSLSSAHPGLWVLTCGDALAIRSPALAAGTTSGSPGSDHPSTGCFLDSGTWPASEPFRLNW